MKTPLFLLLGIVALFGLVALWVLKSKYANQTTSSSTSLSKPNQDSRSESGNYPKPVTLPKDGKSPAELMRDMRLAILKKDPKTYSAQPTEDFPNVRGVVMDWPVNGQVVSVLSSDVGDASLYTTSAFGIIGGIGHESVRNASIRFVKTAELYYKEANLTTDFSYPKPANIRFYFICKDGVHVIETTNEEAKSGKYKDLWAAGQGVITELRLITPIK